MNAGAPSPRSGKSLPAAFRWAIAVWLCVWIPAYWHTWGFVNFLHFCDIAEFLACVGFLFSSPLLLSSQAVASLLPDAVWTLDLLWQILFRHPLLGGTEYMFDQHYPLWVRLISLFHVVTPLLLLWALRHAGYDRRGWILQSLIALPAFIASRFVDPALNMNYAFRDPFFHRQWGPAPIHILVIFVFMIVFVYLPTHLVLSRVIRTRNASFSPQT